jgi:hypothetical protein
MRRNPHRFGTAPARGTAAVLVTPSRGEADPAEPTVDVQVQSPWALFMAPAVIPLDSSYGRQPLGSSIAASSRDTRPISPRGSLRFSTIAFRWREVRCQWHRRSPCEEEPHAVAGSFGTGLLGIARNFSTIERMPVAWRVAFSAASRVDVFISSPWSPAPPGKRDAIVKTVIREVWESPSPVGSPVSLLLFREEQVAKCFWMIRRRPESMVLAAP